MVLQSIIILALLNQSVNLVTVRPDFSFDRTALDRNKAKKIGRLKNEDIWDESVNAKKMFRLFATHSYFTDMSLQLKHLCTKQVVLNFS